MPRTPLREGQGSHVEGTGWKELAEIYTASPPPGWEEGGVCVSQLVARLSCRAPGTLIYHVLPPLLGAAKHG